MKRIILILLLLPVCLRSFGQNKSGAEKLVDEGVGYHDKGDYPGAISRYDMALELDKDNLLALAEKAYSLLALKKYDESIALCKRAIATHPKEAGLKTVYVTYGNVTDALKQTDKSIEIYDEGLRLFPNYYQLYFNKGIALTSVRRYDEGIKCLERSAKLNPAHASSHNGIARLSYIGHNNIPAVLAYCRFLALEPSGGRAKENLAALQKIMRGTAKETSKNSISITMSPDMLDDTTADGKRKPNNFSTTEMILTLNGALDFDEKNKNRTAVQQFIRKFETVCASIKETQKDNSGFFWRYYAPYFIEMSDKHFIEPFAYVAFLSTDAPEVDRWLKTHKDEVERFLEWSKGFEWNTN